MNKFYFALLASVIILSFILILHPSNSPFLKKDSCLDKGGCWDYIRKKCEMNNQGYCIKNSDECLKKNGVWDKQKRYCQL